ncbi:uncharacterized protein EI97DRAFT_459212 [Westerdykella ornata]|uniref:Uncharacterized protein n=1 Tax=Westerdykella ornata TaxID=318751 RepID=A0A6A6JHA6_WESOR|nr:uncharacterized protein EI97DRAFT_459212 [Westerdykella ornata]KAF2275757.1 hypothetical protein EI97DRAFT_459212 [Westerdykella ornata]
MYKQPLTKQLTSHPLVLLQLNPYYKLVALKFPIPLSAASAVPARAAPVRNDMADVATVLTGVADKRDDTSLPKREDASVGDVATVLIGVAEKRDENLNRDESGVVDVGTVLIGVAEKREAHETPQSRSKRAVHGAFAKFVEESKAEAHPQDVFA